MKWMVVSFFTPDDIYRNHAAGLRASCEQFGIEHDIEELKGTGDWPSNVKMKAPFILRKMNEHPDRNIVWIDADGRVRQYPKLFDELDCNVACHWRKGTELLSGTMFFGNNPDTARMIEAWLVEQSKYTMFAEQRSLDAMLKRGGGWRVVDLPASYTLIFDSMRYLGPPVIEHLQASRQAYWRRGRTRHGASVAALRERISRLQMGKSKGAKAAAVPTQRIGSGIPDFEKNYPNARTAALLQGQLKGMPCVIMGNSSSLNRLNLATLTQFPTVGCNRILRMFNPDYYIVVDREPYVQDLELIRKFDGIRVLSSTIYNEKTKCHRVPVQPIPD
ncbi:MAG: hypothetical protein MUC88_20660, partial [Planctomycetes bacterium]|nr:hypothetical protein [Planctomycetota bacterium]